MTETKGVEISTQFIDDLRNRRFWELKEEAEDRTRWKRQFIDHKEEIYTFRKSMDLLISSIRVLDNNIAISPVENTATFN